MTEEKRIEWSNNGEEILIMDTSSTSSLELQYDLPKNKDEWTFLLVAKTTTPSLGLKVYMRSSKEEFLCETFKLTNRFKRYTTGLKYVSYVRKDKVYFQIRLQPTKKGKVFFKYLPIYIGGKKKLLTKYPGRMF